MRVKSKVLLSLSLILVLGSAASVAAQTRTVKNDPAFNAFWIKFKAAIARNDKSGVADLTKLPFMIGGIDHDRAGFLKEYASLFTPRMRRCIVRAKPLKEQDYYEIFCGDQIFLFARADGV